MCSSNRKSLSSKANAYPFVIDKKNEAKWCCSVSTDTENLLCVRCRDTEMNKVGLLPYECASKKIKYDTVQCGL